MLSFDIDSNSSGGKYCRSAEYTTPELTPNLDIFPVSTGILAYFKEAGQEQADYYVILKSLMDLKNGFPVNT